MARLPRIDLPGYPQHLIVRGNNRGIVFLDDVDRYLFMQDLNYATRMYGCEVHAFVLMTNHVHLLATSHEHGALSATMQSIGRRFVRSFNLRRKRTGTLFEGRFRSSLVETERYLLTCMRYIELNPVRAGMVSHPGEYPWSSYRANVRGDPISPLTPHPIYVDLGNEPLSRGAAYQRLFEIPIIDKELELIRACVRQCRVLGTTDFHERLAKELGRPVAAAPHGGPRYSLMREQGVRLPSTLTP